MKKKYIVIPVLILALGLFVGCGSKRLPDGFDEDQVKSVANDFIDKINGGNYEECYNQFGAIMKDSMTEEKLTSTFTPILESLGEFKQIKKYSLSSANSLGTDYAVCTVTCEYANGNATYTISIDKDQNIGGLYIK